MKSRGSAAARLGVGKRVAGMWLAWYTGSGKSGAGRSACRKACEQLYQRGFGVGSRCSTDCSNGAVGGKKLADSEFGRQLDNKRHGGVEGSLGLGLGKERGGLGQYLSPAGPTPRRRN
jgi:hypothetical protein